MIECVDSIVSPETTGQPIQPQVMSAQSLLAYNGGNSWPTYFPYRRARPDLARKGWIISTTLTWTIKSRCYDIEDHGGRVENIGRFMHNADRSDGLPILYSFASNIENVINWASKFGYHHGKDYYLLSAHPNSRHGRHICSPGLCGFPTSDGTQYLFARDYDRSVLNDYMLPQHAAPKPKPVQHASGEFGFAGTYNHDHKTLLVRGTKGNVKEWGDVDEWILLQIKVRVGPHSPGEWRGKVIGTSPN